MENRFEKLEVWKKSHAFVLNIYRITKIFPMEEKYSLIDQLRRSASSVAANIVEGNERKSKKEYLQFLYTAKSSLAESKYQLILARDLNYLPINEYEVLSNQANEIGKMLHGLIYYLKNEPKI